MKNLFRVIAKKILKRNKKFHNLYSGQTCYLFGSGSSIKHYDLKLFGDEPSLCCGNLFLHNDFKYLNVVADIELHPFLNYPFWKNPYYSFEYNRYNAFLRKSGKYKQKHPVFVSISNYPVLYLDNIYYLYHFGHHNNDLNRMDLSGDFSFMKGALYSLIGLALFMGFEKIYLVGMDYLYDIPQIGYFFGYGKSNRYAKDEAKISHDSQLFKSISKTKKIILVTPKNHKSNIIENINYEDLFETKENYKENNRIILNKYLKQLNSLHMNYQIREC